MTAEVIYKHTWNVNDYCQLRYGDGSCIELSTPIGQFSTDQEWIDLALQLYESRPETPDPLEDLLRAVPDAMLVAEVLRRHLNITVEGGMV
jgi:hypothetical protein